MTEPEPIEAALVLTDPQVEDVVQATEAVRAADFPNVAADLLATVLRAERDNLDNRSSAARSVRQAVEHWLASNPPATPAGTSPSTTEGPGS